jgi:CBS domain containing-hemolysin-like protein
MMSEQNSHTAPPSQKHTHDTKDNKDSHGVVVWLKKLIQKKADTEENLREVLEDYIEEMSSNSDISESSLNHELTLLTNILELRDLTAEDVMIPRVDIVAIDIDTSPDELLDVLASKQHHRIPVYRETLDDIIGVIHIKDTLKALANKKPIVLKNLVREAPVISPALPVFDLLLMMRQSGHHMTFVVDEYGGIDGLVTIGDVVGSIVGELQGKFDKTSIPDIAPDNDGGFVADARTEIYVFEEEFGQVLSEEDRDTSDTLGGFIFTLAGRVPSRGEIVSHDVSGFTFEILEADPRRVLKVRVIPPKPMDMNPVVE